MRKSKREKREKKGREGRGEEKEIFNVLGHFPNASNRHSRVRLKPETGDSVNVSCGWQRANSLFLFLNLFYLFDRERYCHSTGSLSKCCNSWNWNRPK